jgi:hypothetical protein
MTKWKKIRTWINRDDGKMYQVGNKNFGALEIIGWFFLILALLVYTLHDKAGIESTWIGWLSFFLGLVFIVWSFIKEKEDEDK